MTSKLVGAEEAERIGLVNRVAPPEELEAATEQLAGELLACSPTAIGLAKRVIDSAAKLALAQTLEQDVTAQAVCARSPDYAEGARALAERRAPQFG
jgi:enoyl-CoA hydratase/carnithine racemase